MAAPETRAETLRAERERRTRLALIDAVTQDLNDDYDTVEGLKAAVKKTLAG